MNLRGLAIVFACTFALSVPASVVEPVVVEMREICSVTHSLGGPAPTITTVAIYDNGDVEYSFSSNFKYRASPGPERARKICTGIVGPLLEATAELEKLAENQHDTEIYSLSVEDRSVTFPRRIFREAVRADGSAELDEEDPLGPPVKGLLRELDKQALEFFGKRYAYPLLPFEAE